MDCREGEPQVRVTASTSYSALSPQLQGLIAEARGVSRRPTAVLQTSGRRTDPRTRAAKVPALPWPEWVDALAPPRLEA
jgi:hypothetical protein